MLKIFGLSDLPNITEELCGIVKHNIILKGVIQLIDLFLFFQSSAVLIIHFPIFFS